MQDGRSKPPPPPDEVIDILITAQVNHTLGTNYTPAEIEELPELFIEKVLLFANG